MVILGIAGGSGSGKTTLVNRLMESFPRGSISHVPMDAYYYDHSHLSESDKIKYNFDHPAAIDFDLLINHLASLKKGISVERPGYSFISCSRTNQTEIIHPSKIIILDGLFVLFHPRLREELSLNIFLDVSFDNRLKRSIRRDMAERGRTRKATQDRFLFIVDPMHNEFVQPSKLFADVVLDANSVDIDQNVKYISTLIENGKGSIQIKPVKVLN